VKRAHTAALCAALVSLACLPARRAAADLAGVPPPAVPRLIPPQLSPGFEPIAPDELGLSPRGHFFVFQDGVNLQLVRTGSDHVIFDGRVFSPGDLAVDLGFDPADHFLFLLETAAPNDFRLRIMDPVTGLILFNRHFLTRPEIRANLVGNAVVIITRTSASTSLTVLNGAGRITLRRSYRALAQVSLNFLFPSLAVLSPDAFGQSRVEVYNAFLGQPTLRAALQSTDQAGFEPIGPAFVIEQSTSSGSSFRVKMVLAHSGRILLSRTFTGTPNVGFTADSSLLGVESFRSLDTRGTQLLLFSTLTGQQLFIPRN
jgi:hypothetical protein